MNHLFLSPTAPWMLSSKTRNENWLNFKASHSFDKRRSESARILRSYPSRIPIIIEAARSSTAPVLDKCKFLTPGDMTVGQFLHVIRKRMRVSPEHALFIYLSDNTLPTTSALLCQVYKDHRDDDGFLYMRYASENTFGWE